MGGELGWGEGELGWGELGRRFMRSWQGKSGGREMGGGGFCQADSGRGTLNEYCGV